MHKFYLDDLRDAPDGYELHRSVVSAVFGTLEAAYEISETETNILPIVEINLDHDAGDYAECGGDFIEYLKWLEGYCYISGFKLDNTLFQFHSMNPVEVENMKAICRKNGWRYIK